MRDKSEVGLTGGRYELLPNFMILGAAKAGTTTLFSLLKQHPEVFLPFNKEPMFFSTEKNYAKGVDWYIHTYFKDAGEYASRGEASPHYLYWSEKTSPRIQSAFAGHSLKFIIIFRDPVQRAYSWYWNMVRENNESLSFTEALLQETLRLEKEHQNLTWAGSMRYGYQRGSNYAAALRPFLEKFPRESFLFLLHEDLVDEFNLTVHKLLDHLGINHMPDIKPIKQNPAAQARSRRLQSWLRVQSPMTEFGKRILPLRLRYGFKSWLLTMNTQPINYPDMPPEVEMQLREKFAPGVKELEELIDRNLSRWMH